MKNRKAKRPSPRVKEMLSTQIAERAPSFKEMQLMTTGLLSRGMRWIQARNVARAGTRRLHVCATVGLGEKRFVSVIECDGVQFLVGGGATNVSLLARLPNQQAVAPSDFAAIHAECAH